MKCLVSLALVSAVLMPLAAHAKPQTLNFESMYTDAQAQTVDIFKPWAAEFKEISQGDLTVNHFAVGTIVEYAELRNAVANGVVDMSTWVTTQSPRENPLGYLSSLPFFTKGAQHGTLATWQLIEQYPEVLEEYNKAGVFLTQCMGASYGLIANKGIVRTPAELAGKRVLTLNGADAKIVESWGGSPVHVAPGDAYVGLQRGMGDAMLCPMPFVRGYKFFEVAPYVTVIDCTQSVIVMSINQDVWDDLTPDQQKLLRDRTGKALSMRWARHLDEDVASICAMIENNGGTVARLTEEELALFREKSAPLLDSYFVEYFEKNCGLKDAKTWFERAYAASDSTPHPNVR